MLIQMEMEPQHAAAATASGARSRAVAEAAAAAERRVTAEGADGGSRCQRHCQSSFHYATWLAWLGFSGLGVAVGRLDRPAQIADAYVEYADMSHTHTHAHYFSNYTYSAVLAI